MNRRPYARRPVLHYGERVRPYDVELTEADMDLDRRSPLSLAEATALWQAQVDAERSAS